MKRTKVDTVLLLDKLAQLGIAYAVKFPNSSPHQIVAEIGTAKITVGDCSKAVAILRGVK